MKTWTILLSVFITCLTTFAQVPQTCCVKVYTNIASLNARQADKQMTLPIAEKKVRFGFWGLTSKNRMTFYHTALSRQLACEAGKVLGYSLNDSVYIKTGSNTMHRRNRFALATKVGRFYIYTDKGVYVDARLPLVAFTYPETMFVDFKTGKKQPLISMIVRKVIKDNAALLTRFRTDKKRGKHLTDYLLAYSGS